MAKNFSSRIPSKSRLPRSRPGVDPESWLRDPLGTTTPLPAYVLAEAGLETVTDGSDNIMLGESPKRLPDSSVALAAPPSPIELALLLLSTLLGFDFHSVRMIDNA